MGAAYYLLTIYWRQRRVKVVTLGGGNPATAVTSRPLPLFQASDDRPVGLAAPDKVSTVEELGSEGGEPQTRL